MSEKVEKRGPIAWMAGNSVAANLFMVVLVLGGLMVIPTVKQEVFPEFELDIISIAVPYPGASPSEVEQGILLAAEEAVRGLDGIKKVTASAKEGIGTVVVELMTGTNANKALQDVKNAIDRITSFPEDAERPLVQLLTNRREVISLIIYGDLDEGTLRHLGEKAREDILQQDGITTVDLLGVRPLEISIEVPLDTLRRYGLTLADVAAAVQRGAIEIPAGGVDTDGGEVLLRTAERRDYGRQFRDIPVVSRPDGTMVRLDDMATIIDGFRDTDRAAFYNGKPAVRISVARIGDQKPIEIAKTVKTYRDQLSQSLPAGVKVATWVDASEIYRDRINLLNRNAGLGLLLVLFILGAFLELRLAFWVTLGIPISVLGSFLLFPAFDVSINMISLFAFIVTLGIVVDDAVVVGENIFEMRQRGMSSLDAAITGAKQIAVPVTFSILTNIVAFSPMLFVPGLSGKFFRVIPIIAISVFLISLLESLFILPAHLAHQSRKKHRHRFAEVVANGQKRFASALSHVIENAYRPSLRIALEFRYLTVAVGLALLIFMIGLVVSGRIQFTFMPSLDADEIQANATLTFGAPIEDTRAVADLLVETAMEVMTENGGMDISRGILTDLGVQPVQDGADLSGSHRAMVSVYLVPSDQRPITATQFANLWRQKLGTLAGLESLTFKYSTGPAPGKPIDIQLAHDNLDLLERAASDLAGILRSYAGVTDIDDGYSRGKPQLDFTIRPEASAFGITAADLGNQLRNAFYGNRAFRQQRGREEIWVMVRLPEDERRSEYHVKRMLLRTPSGGEIPIEEAAEITRNRSYTEINRGDGRRVIDVTADVNPRIANANKVLADLESTSLPSFRERYPGLRVSYEGEQREQRDMLSSLARNFVLAMMVIFALLAIPFRSYVQPLVVMTAIPFGVVGAILGHLVMGYELSIISMMGIVALSGIVVNDSLVLVHAANERRDAGGANPFVAITEAGMRRFRPILLTSLTTFFGLAPMIFETSVQARFLIPMAISLGFGVLFSTAIILVIVPSLYLIIEDLRALYTDVEAPDHKALDEVSLSAP